MNVKPTTIILIFLAVALSSCTAKNPYSLEKNQEIIDYTDASIEASRRLSNSNDQTIFVYKNNKISRQRFHKLAKNKKVKSLESITDKSKIEEMGFSFADVKRIILIQ